MATIHSIPTETLAAIFGWLEPWEQESLTIFALVCRDWRDPAQRVLFSAVSFTYSPIAQARLWLTSPARNRYRTSSLTLLNRIESQLAESIISACPALLSFTVLHPEGYSLCQHLPEIKILTVLLLGQVPLNVVPLRCRLRAISLHAGVPLQSYVYEKILGNSRETLTSLRIEYLQEDSAILPLVDFLATSPFPHLRHLTLDYPSVNEDTRKALKHFPTVTHLTIFELSNTAWWAGAVAESNLDALEVLAFPYFYSTSDSALRGLSLLINTPRDSRIRQLEFPALPAEELGTPLGCLFLEACEERSVRVVCQCGFVVQDDLPPALLGND